MNDSQQLAVNLFINEVFYYIKYNTFFKLFTTLTMRYNFTLVKLSIWYDTCRRSIRLNVTRSIISYGPTVRHDPQPRRRVEAVFGGFA